MYIKKLSLLKYNKTETIARKTIFLHEIHGGLDIKDPEAQYTATRIKYILNLKQEKNPPPWTYLAVKPNLLLRLDWLDKNQKHQYCKKPRKPKKICQSIVTLEAKNDIVFDKTMKRLYVTKTGKKLYFS